MCIKTAKELAYQAYIEGVNHKDHEKINDQFELWWNKVYNGSDDRPKEVYPEFDLFLEGKRYIQAE